MLASDLPPKFPIPFANGAAGPYIRPIPEASQIGIQSGAASLTDGFPPDSFSPITAGGVPPFGQDFNGLLKQITQWSRWTAAGGAIPYDAVFAASIAGYSKGAVVGSNVVLGNQYMSTVDGNVSDPDSPSSANWVTPPGQLGTGAQRSSSTTEAIFGWVLANGLTIGNTLSNATNRANIDTWPLFNFHWLNFSNTQCPVYTSAGVPTTRGVSAAADFVALKTIAVLDKRGTTDIGADGMGNAATNRLFGVPIVSGNVTTPGSIIGENRHSLNADENGQHDHENSLIDPGHIHPNVLNDPGHIHTTGLAGGLGTGTAGGAGNGVPINPQTIAALSNTTGISLTNASQVTGASINNSMAGTGEPHNTVARSMVSYIHLKL